MKSNIYSIFIFLIGLFATYIVTTHFQKTEIKDQQLEISIQSQAISHNLQQKILSYGQQLANTSQSWSSVEQINTTWQQDVITLHTLTPYFSNISLYLIEQLPNLTITESAQHYFPTEAAMARHAKHLLPLPRALSYTGKYAIFMSEHMLADNDDAMVYFQTPIFINNHLVAYLGAALNITELLKQQVSTFQITPPFSLSEIGRTIFSVLPEHVAVSDIKQKFSIPILNREWKLMIWPQHQHHYYRYISTLGLVMSILFSLLTFLTLNNKKNQRKLNIQRSHLSAINKDFSASKSKLIQSNKLTSLGEIATGIAHEINQPLQVICIHADLCAESLEKQDYRLVNKSFQSILSQVDRIEKIVKQVGSFGRNSESDHYKKEEPANIFESVLNIVINQYNQENVELRQVIPPSLPAILCNKTQIEQVLVNLLINAKDAVEESEEKVVFIKAHDKQGKLYIEVSDSGSGIEPSKLDDIFTPFYTTKALGKGTGLGLSISYSIIHQHKGEFQVSSEMGKGSTFTVILPLN